MPRPKKCRKVGYIPTNKNFYPQVNSIEEIVLAVEEIEALRLSDFMMLDQDKASCSMNVSRGTFQRILNNARQKIADAIINGKSIHIDGGDYELDYDVCCCKDKNMCCGCGKCGRCSNCSRQ